jgi:hypothetical protein
MNTVLGTSKPALIIYCFAQADPGSTLGGRYLRLLWDGCRRLGMSEPLPGVNVGTDFPELPSSSQTFVLLAAARRPRVSGAVYTAFLFAEHDVAAVSAASASVPWIKVTTPNLSRHGTRVLRKLVVAG